MLGIYELGLKIGKVFNRSPRFEYLQGEEALGWAADSSKLKSVLNLDTYTSFEDGLKRLLHETNDCN